MIFLLPFLLVAPPSADEIMQRVAENQERALAARSAYVYDMNVFVRLKRANGKLAREESRDYVVAPGEKGARRKLVKVEGHILEGGRTINYADAGYRTRDSNIDGALTDSFAREVMWEKGEFGPMVEWFPLTREGDAKYSFRFEGEEKYHNYDVYKISYVEKDKNKDADECWRGEALIEKNEFEPVLITAQWDCKVPNAVRAILGTNVEHLGAKITYQRFGDGVWFPVTCGGELKLRVLFLYARTIGFSAKNSDFRKADVQSSVDFDDVQ
jgi:hypothetical protein